jgi:hypothetical protein
VHRKSVVFTRIAVLVPFAFALAGATGENTVFTCGGATIHQELGTCNAADGGVPCDVVAGAVDAGSSGTTPPPSSSEQPSLELTILPTATVAPGHTRVLAAHVVGTASQVAAVQTVYWGLSLHDGEQLGSGCPDGMVGFTGTGGSCLGTIHGQSSNQTGGGFRDSSTFYAPYQAYSNTSLAACSAQPSRGLDIDVTAFSKDSAGSPSLAATATLHIDCPGFSLTPPMVTLAPGSAAMNFQATYADGTLALVDWSVQNLGSPIGTVGSIDPFTGRYLPPPVVPTPVPFALVVATLLVDPSIGDASIVSIQDVPASVTITNRNQTVFFPDGNPTFQAQVSNLSSPFDSTDVMWTLTRGTSTSSYHSADIMLNQNTGVLTISGVSSSAMSPNDEEGPYVVTATSRQDTTKSDSLNIQIYRDSTHVPTTSVQLTPTTAGIPALLPTQTQQFIATVQNDPLGSSNVKWTLVNTASPTMPIANVASTHTWLSDGGLLTAGVVSGPMSETYTVTAVDKTTSGATASATVTVTGPAAVTISPATAAATIAPGDSLAFSAVVTNVVPASAHDVTWTLTTGTGMAVSDQSDLDAQHVFHSDPLAAGLTYIVTAKSNVDASKTDTVTITVASDTSGLAGTIGYLGSSTGQVYVTCAEATNSLLTAGTTAVSTQPSPTNAAHFRIRGGSCPAGATVTAWMDTLGTGHFVLGADPSVIVPVLSGTRNLSLMLADYQARQPPSTATAPSVTQVQGESNGAVVLFTPYADAMAKLEYAQEYDVYYQQSSMLTSGSTLDATGTKVTVKPGNFGVAFLPLTTGSYSVGVQAKFVSAGGTTTLSPASLTSPLTVTVTVPVTSNGSIAGSADLSALTSSLVSTSMLHVLAFDPTAPSTLAGASRGTLTTGHTIADFNVLGLGTGTFGLKFFVDFDNNGQIDPTDLVASLFDPVRYFDSGGPTSGYSLKEYVNAASATALQAAFPVPSRSAEAHVLTDVYFTSGSAVSSVTYSVTSGSKAVVQATHLATNWDTTRDLFAVEHLMTPQPFRRNTFSGMSDVGTSLPTPTAMTSFLVRYADGSSETLTAPVVDLLTSYHLSVTPAVVTDVPITPVFSWNLPAAGNLATSNALDHFTLVITQGSGASLMTVRTVTITPPTTSYTWANPALSNNADYSYRLSAVDAAGDRVWTSGTFHTVVGP